MLIQKSASDKVRVAKNTVVLYFRMIITLVVSLYTSRVVLQALGVEDFGIYNVVGGIVASLSFLQQTLVICFQRYFCKFIPHKNYKKLSEILGAAIYIILAISLLVVFVVETIGIWFLNYKLLIPETRLVAANWVLQLSLLTFIFTIFRAIYNAVIISFEEMTVFAYISILEVILKLAVAFLVTYLAYDHLTLYAILMLIVAVLTSLVYFAYVRGKYTFIKHDLTIITDKSIFKELGSFMGYSTIGTMANVLKSQGLNFVLNMFYGPIVNTARSISFQVYTAVSGFTQNFQTAFSPHLMKKCETHSKEQVEHMVHIVSKFSFYAMLVLSLPILIYAQQILELWLGRENVPYMAAFFTRVILLIGLIETLSSPIVNIIMVNGNIKGFMLNVSFIIILVIPFSYLALKVGYDASAVYVVDLVFSAIAQFIRVLYLQKMMGYGILRYGWAVVVPCTFSVIACGILSYVIPFIGTGIPFLVMGTVVSEFLLITFIFFLGMNKTERQFITSKLNQYVFKHRSTF